MSQARKPSVHPAPPKSRKVVVLGARNVGPFAPTKKHTLIFFFSLLSANISFCFAGKSSLTVLFVDGHFVESYYPTIENTFRKTLRFRNQEFDCQIVDTAGQVFFENPLFLVFLSFHGD